MADLDSRSKRASSVGIALGFCILAPPFPAGALGQEDQQHAAWNYSGILAAAAVPPQIIIGPTYATVTDTRTYATCTDTRTYAEVA